MSGLAFPKQPRIHDRAYMDRVRELPCCACARGYGIEAHHRTGAGLAMKANDRDTMPLCKWCHHDFHAARGRFWGWTKTRRREWQLEMATKTQRALEAA